MRLVRLSLPVIVFCGAVCARAQTTPVLAQPLPAQTLAPGGAALTIDLRNYLGVPGVEAESKFAVFETVYGKVFVELRAKFAPRHVANFLAYAQAAAYDNSFMHRAASFDNGGVSIVQGGGYRLPLITTIPKLAPVALEYNLPNARGTLAAARSTDVNSATSEWYFNVRDNSSNLNEANGGGYTVFGRVLGGGMAVLDQMAALPRYNAGGAFAELPLRNYTTGDVTDANLVLVNSVREASLFPIGGGASIIELTVQNSASNVVTALLSGSTLTLTPVASGSATITVRAQDIEGASTQGSFTVTVAAGIPVFTAQPRSQTMASGSTLALSAPATGAASYVWRRNGVDVPGATTSTLVIKNIGAAQAGTYVVYATNSVDTVASAAANVDVITTDNPGRLINLSILTPLAPGEPMTMGTVLGGANTSGAKPLLARAAGPSLAQLGVTDFLPDPTMTLVNTSVTPNATVAANNDWGGGADLSAAFTRVGAFGYTSGSSKDAAIFQPGLSPGNYTVQVNDTGSGTGTVIAELYDASSIDYTPSTPRLINVSVLKQIAGGTQLTTGFVVGGSTSKTVLIRAVGPTLGVAPFNLEDVMADPQLKLYDASQAVIANSDDWGGSLEIMAAAEAVGAFRLAGATSKDAVLLLSLRPGNYSAQVSGAGNSGGTAIVEVYEVP